MNKKELISAIGKRSGMPEKDAEKMLNNFCKIVEEELLADRKVRISGFGVFEVRERAARKGKNPRTGKPFEVEASKLPAFKAGKVLKEIMNA